MNTEQLRYFVSVARYRNFTETAREFYVTQPAVTHQISALEREVGARLFLRTTRNVSLTRAGELFLEDAKRILDQEERALGRLRQLESSGCWELRIGYPVLPPLFARLIAAYREAYPQVRVELIRRDATGIQAGIDAAAYDVSFSVLSDLKGMNGHPAASWGPTSTAWSAAGTPLPGQRRDRLRQAGHGALCLQSHTGGAYMYKQFLQICRGLGFTPASVTQYPALEDVIFAVECGQAIAILPFRIREYMHTTGLAFVPLEGHGQTIELGVAWREPSDNPAVSGLWPWSTAGFWSIRSCFNADAKKYRQAAAPGGTFGYGAVCERN